MGSINQSLFSSSAGVRSYIETQLQPPEVSIFVKYRDAFYGKKILDIGVGAGRTSFHLRNCSEQYIGVDYSSAMIDYCKRTYKELSFAVCDARDLSAYESDQFDFILFSYNGIDYVSHEDRLTILGEIKRVLKKGGTFVFATHNRDYRNILTKPKLTLPRNPLRVPGAVRAYVDSSSNHAKLAPQAVSTAEYAIINDSGNNFGLLTYYISKQEQMKQLVAQGFSVIDTFALDGQQIPHDKSDTASCWIYYVARL